jgi:DNA-binding transcriptional LysR family regulator
MVDLRHLYYFSVLADQQSVNEAAKKLRLSQPSLSRQLRRLEEQVGAQLFSRTTRGISLTPAGVQLARDAQRLLLSADVALTRARKLSTAKPPRVRIGFIQDLGEILISSVVRAIREKSNIHVELHALSMADQEKALCRGRIDLGLLTHCAHLKKRYASRRLATVPIWIALPSGHRLAALSKVTVDDLAYEPLVTLGEQDCPGYRNLLTRVFDSVQTPPPVAVEVNEFTSALAQVAAGDGVCLIPEFLKTNRRRGVEMRSVSGTRIKFEVYAVWRPDVEPRGLDEVISALEAAAKKRLVG